MKTIVKQKKELARPLKVLVPFLKNKLIERKRVRDEASIDLDIEIGQGLNEAKEQQPLGQWGNWLAKNFHLSQQTAALYMRMARVREEEPEGAPSVSQSDFIRSHGQKNYNVRVSPPKWLPPVQDALKRFKVESFNLEQHEISAAKERKLERELALKLIDIGFKVLSKQVHPDQGGSHDAMRRLNVVRARLKEAA